METQNLGKKINIQAHETQWTTTKIYLPKFIMRHIIIKLLKVKDFETRKRNVTGPIQQESW